MFEFFNVILYEPILNLLVFIYNVVPGSDIGVAIIVMTVIIKLALYPFTLKSIKSQKALQEIQPKVDAIKAKYKDQKEKLAQEMMEVYKREKVSPFSSCLPLLIQFPFLIAVYQVFRTGLSNGSLDSLYPFVTNPGTLNPIAFGFMDLSEPQIILAVITGIAQYVQMKMLNTKKPPIKSEGSKDESMMVIMNKQMTFMMPLLTVFIGISLPGGLILYWLVTTILTVAMQFFAFRDKKELAVEVIDSKDSGSTPPQNQSETNSNQSNNNSDNSSQGETKQIENK